MESYFSHKVTNSRELHLPLVTSAYMSFQTTLAPFPALYKKKSKKIEAGEILKNPLFPRKIPSNKQKNLFLDLFCALNTASIEHLAFVVIEIKGKRERKRERER